MKLNIYSVHDRKAAVFARPFIAPNDGMALRSFAAAKLDPSTELAKFPEDFSLYLLGSFDDETGELSPVVPIVVTLEA